MIVNFRLKFFLLLISTFFVASCSNDSSSPGNTNPDLSNVALSFIGIVKNDPLRIHSMPIGGKLQLIANGKNQNADTIDMSSVVSWSIEDISIATVNTSGLLETIKTGATKVVVKHGDKTVSATVTVVDMVLTIESPVARYVAGDTTTLVAYVKSVDNVSISINQSIVWKSSDNNIASIGAKGILQLKKSGDVVITGNFYGVSNTININVLGQFVLKVDQSTINSTSLSWNTEPTADFYRLKWITSAFGTLGSQVISDTSNKILATRYVHQNLNADTYYEYHLEAITMVGGLESVVNISNTLAIEMPGNNSAILVGEKIGSGVDSNSNLVKVVPIKLTSSNNMINMDVAIVSKQAANGFLVSDYLIKISNNSDALTFCGLILNGVNTLDNKGNPVNQNRSTTAFMIAGKRFSNSLSGNTSCIGPRRSSYMYTFGVLSDADYGLTKNLTATTITGSATTQLSFPVSAVVPVSYSLVVTGNITQLRVTIKNMGTQAEKATSNSRYILLDDQNNPLESRALKLVTGWTGDLAAGQSNILVADMTFNGTSNKVHVFVDY